MTAPRKKLTALAVDRLKYVTLYSQGERGAGKLLINRIPHERGLYLAITPAGAKSWRYDYRYQGKRQCLVYGQHGDISMKTAEEKHAEARRLLAEGKNPAAIKQAAKEKRAAIGDNSFKAVAAEWHAEELRANPKLSDSWKDNIRRWLDLANEAFGSKPLPDIEAGDVLALVKKIAAAGHAKTADAVRGIVARVFNYGIANLRAPKGFNPALAVQGAIKVPKPQHRKKLNREDIKPFIEAVKNSEEPEQIKLGLLLLLHTFPRRAELIETPWREIPVDGDYWTLEAARMKMDRDGEGAHIVPMSRQVKAMFARLRELAGTSPYVFPSPQKPSKPRCKPTLNLALHRLGYKGIFSAHGARATAASMLADAGFPREVVDRQLAHAEDDSTQAAYFRNQFLAQRAAMLQSWSDLLDGLEAGGAKVIPIGATAA